MIKASCNREKKILGFELSSLLDISDKLIFFKIDFTTDLNFRQELLFVNKVFDLRFPCKDCCNKLLNQSYNLFLYIIYVMTYFDCAR